MSNPRVALITGITGQDGSYLAEHLIAPFAAGDPGAARCRPG